MLPDEMKLGKLLEKLFEDDDKPISEDILVLKRRIPPRQISACCTYNYAIYEGWPPMDIIGCEPAIPDVQSASE